MAEHIKLKLNKPMRGYRPGTILIIEIDDKNLPVDPYWRNRLNDAQIDAGIEVYKENKGSSKPKTKTTKKEVEYDDSI